jgi:glycine C-acetyltransferase
MEGDLGALDKICALKKEFDFRILIDDAHGMGVMGPEGRGTHTHFHCEDDIDLYFCAFAKTMAIIGGFIGCNDPDIITYLRFNMRSQIYAKSLPMPIVYGVKRRLEIINQHPEFREKLWDLSNYLQHSLQAEGFNTGVTESPVTPVFFPGDVNQGTNVVVDLRENYGIFCSIVVYPVVPKGQIMLRIIPTAAHTREQADRTISVFKEVKKKLDAGEYNKPMPDMHIRK